MAFKPSWTDPRFSVVREVVQGVGGLTSQADLGRRWGISRQRVHQLTREVDFPKPVATISGHGAWIAQEADAWFLHHQELRAVKTPPRASPERVWDDDDW
jgi:predicted DNA-binding transcriptional regulator AlpA